MNVRAHALLLADIEPFLLIFGIQDTNEYFELEMNQNFEVSSFFAKELYHKLLDIFKTKYDSGHKFTPNDFLIFVNKKVSEYINTEIVQNGDILRYRRDIEEADKVYFYGWIYHTTKNNTQLSNLEKTRLLMGDSVQEKLRKKY